MFSTKEMNPRITDYPLRKEKKISKNIINKKANSKLDYIVDKYKAAMGVYVEKTRDRFLDKDILFTKLRYLKEINLKYQIENRFWAISYDLFYKTVMEDIFEYGPEKNCSFIVALSGKFKINGARFIVDKMVDANDPKVDEIIKKLNNTLILDRITSLDLTDFKIAYNSDEKKWEIKFRSIIGSTTWNFIPPVTYLIKPKDEEYFKTIEILELIGDALINP